MLLRQLPESALKVDPHLDQCQQREFAGKRSQSRRLQSGVRGQDELLLSTGRAANDVRAAPARMPFRATRSRCGLYSRHLPRRPDRQLQRLAQCAQISVPWPDPISLPEVDAALADPHLFSKLGNGQPALDPRFSKVAGKVGFPCQGIILSSARWFLPMTRLLCKQTIAGTETSHLNLVAAVTVWLPSDTAHRVVAALTVNAGQNP